MPGTIENTAPTLIGDSDVPGLCPPGLWWVRKSEDGKSITLMVDPLLSFVGVLLSTAFETSTLSSGELLREQ